jgi:hypothetical protein
MQTKVKTNDPYFRELIDAATCGHCRKQPSTRSWKFQPETGGTVLIAALCDPCADRIHADLKKRAAK